MMFKIAVVLFCICIGPVNGLLSASNGQGRPADQIGIRQGLSQGYIYCMLQDREGFVWVGTKNGLNRYDGRRFKTFRANHNAKYALSSDAVVCLWEYGDFLLVGTDGGGLNFYEKRTEKFFRIPDHLAGNPFLKNSPIHGAVVDVDGVIWIYEQPSKGRRNIRKITLPNDFFDQLGHSLNPWSGVRVETPDVPTAEGIYMSKDRLSLWIKNDTALFKLNTRTGLVTSINLPVKAHISSILEGRAGTTWVGHLKGVSRIRNDTAIFFKSSFPIKKIYAPDEKGRLLVYGSSGKLYAFPSEAITGQLRISEAKLVTENPDFNCSLFDQSGNLWLGSSGYGIFRVAFLRNRFQNLFRGNAIYSKPFSDRDGTVGYFDSNRGLLVSGSGGDQLVPRKFFFQGMAGSMSESVRYLPDPLGGYWVYYKNHHYESFLTHTGAKSKISVFAGEKPQASFCRGENGLLWIAQNGKLSSVRRDLKQITTFSYTALQMPEHDVLALVQTQGGHLWIATPYGLVEAIPNGQEFLFRLLTTGRDPLRSLLNNNIATLLTDEQDPGVLWIGSKGGGLARFDTRTRRLIHRGMGDGFPDDVIYGILPDRHKTLWMSSNRGLIRYDPASGKISNYTSADGLQDEEFNTWAYAKAEGGQLMFGGVKGLNVFNPDDFEENLNVPKVYVTGLKINNTNASVLSTDALQGRALEFSNGIILPAGQNSLTFEFAALEYSVPEKNRFRYYLEGAEAEWRHESNDNYAQYLNLPPGNYIFTVMGSNHDGVWNLEPKRLKVTILPEWYQTWWAYGVYGAICLLIVVLIVRFRLNQIRAEQSRLLEREKADKILELDRFRNRFYTHITHEFRTPLTLILGTGDQLERQLATDGPTGLDAMDVKGKLGVIRRNGRNLLHLVNQLLDIARAENGHLRIEMESADIVPCLEDIIDNFRSLAEQNRVDLTMESQVQVCKMDLDPEIIRQIFTNIIANALKFTPEGGTVKIRIKPTHQNVVVEVADNGTGILPEHLPYIFDRFFQAGRDTTEGGGSGIGLALTRELVRLLKGEIQVYSKSDQGTTFSVTLPIFHQVDEQKKETDLPEVARAAAPTQPRKPRLLVVEDNSDLRAYLRSCLEETFLLDFCKNGEAGLEQALTTIPDIILSDVVMPLKNGLQLCEDIKNEVRTSHIPFVMLTARTEVNDRISGLSHGADAYLCKPFHKEELHAVLGQLLANRRRVQEYYRSANRGEAVPATSHKVDPFIEKLYAYFECRLADPSVSLKEVCQEMAMSRTNLNDKVQALTGQSVMQLLRERRLAKAKDLLLSTDLDVTAVATEVGFNDVKYFSKTFAETYQMTPRAFRMEKHT